MPGFIALSMDVSSLYYALHLNFSYGLLNKLFQLSPHVYLFIAFESTSFPLMCMNLLLLNPQASIYISSVAK